MTLKEYTASNGDVILYKGSVDTQKFDILTNGYGDLWHSSFEQGYKNAFQDLAHQSSVLFWYINDFDGLDECVSWRINPNQFAVRKSVWDTFGGFDGDYQSIQTAALDFGYNALRTQGAIPLYVKGLFVKDDVEKIIITARDRYIFFRKNFKADHSLFMLYRKGVWKWKEWNAYLYAKKNYALKTERPLLKPRALKQITQGASVSYIIPTMSRQHFTARLLDDLAEQTYIPEQVIVVDATPEKDRDASVYSTKDYPFKLNIFWQQSKGSCRARNEAIEKCTGDYIVFGDDDIRILPNFIENHIRLLQTYHAGGCNGLDIMAANPEQDLDDLKQRLQSLGDKRWFVGSAQMFSNANSCVKREFVNQLVGNDINYDGGYGEDGDFGMSLLKLGVPILHNPFSVNLHLKPPSGGYRFWGTQAKIMGKKRKAQPWELDTPVKWVRPVPSPTLMYQFYKQFTPEQISEFRHRYFLTYLFKGTKSAFLIRLLRIPYKILQFNKSVFYARKLLALGSRTK